MSKAEVLAVFAAVLSDPGSETSGEYLEKHVVDHARRIAKTDREGLVAALREWFGLRREPETMLAVAVTRELGLSELAEDVRQLRAEIVSATVFKPHYQTPVDDALAALGD